MEINLSLISEDCFEFNISAQEQKTLGNINDIESLNEDKNIENIIVEELNKNYLYLKNINIHNNFDIVINKNKLKNKKENSLNNCYEYDIEIKTKDKLKKEIEAKINSCMKKEKLLINKENEFKTISDNIIIDEKLLEKKLISLIEIKEEEKKVIIEELALKILDYDYFIKDITSIQDRLNKYRDSIIVALCFKIYIKYMIKPIKYIISKRIIFLNNEKLFEMANNIYLKIIKIIIDKIFNDTREKIYDDEIFKSHKEDYEKKLDYYKEICYLFPLLKFFENSQEKNIYELNEDLSLDFSEIIYDQILRVNSHIPKRNGLNITLDYLKEYSNIGQSYAMSLRRILLMYEKYQVLFPNFKKSSFLYN